MSEDPPSRRPGMPEGSSPIRNPGQGGTRLVPWASGMAKGVGYDSVTRSVRASAAKTGKLMREHEVLNTQGQYVQRKVLQIESIEKMREVLQLGAELDVGYDAFSANSVGKFLRESRVDSYNLYFLVICYVQTTEVRLDGYELDESCRPDQMGDAEFRDGYGDYFVSGWVKGGYLIGLAEIRAKTQQALTRVKTETSAGYNAGSLSANGRFASDWEKWSARSDLESRLELIYAGMDGTALKTVPAVIGNIPTPKPRQPVTNDVRPRQPLRPRPLTDKEVLVVDDDDDPGDNPPEYLAGSNGTSREAADAGSPERQPEFEHLGPSIGEAKPVDATRVEMTMQGLLDAADALPGQVRTYGVPLYAILEAYSPRFRKAGELSIDQQEFERKRELVNRVYLKARFVSNSVAYAIAQGSDFATPAGDLVALQSRMNALMDECVRASYSLKQDPTFTLPASIVLPADAEIPQWTIERTKFSPFVAPPNPQLFTHLLEEAVQAAADHKSVEGRPLLKAYLSLILERSVANYIAASDTLKAVAITFRALDAEPAERAANLRDLADASLDAGNAWSADSASIAAAFGALEGKAGLDAAALGFLSNLNPLLFGPDKAVNRQLYGFAAFWASLTEALDGLAQKARLWGSTTRFDDVVDYGKARTWSEQADAFRAEASAIDTRVRVSLAA